MANGILPRVRLIFPCDDAVRDQRDGKWVLKHPWSTVMLPPGANFPYRLVDLWLYAQLAEGVGRFDLRVEMLQVRDDNTRRAVGSGDPVSMEFPGGSQLLAFDTAFHMKMVPFREAGLYEFRVVVEVDEGRFQALEGQTALLRVLDWRATS
jgi:hypothetical protein